MSLFFSPALLMLACTADPTSASDSGAMDTGSEGAVPAGAWHEDCPVGAPEQRMVDVGEVSLNVACQGSGPTVVFLHGFPEFHHSWSAVMTELAEEYRLIAPDQRGFNLSDKPEAVEDYALPLLTADIITLLPLISPEPALLVAHDWGGVVGWSVAHHPDAWIRGLLATNGPHPQRFSWLINNDPEQQQASAYMDLFRSDSAEKYLSAEALISDIVQYLSEADQALYMEALNQPGAITGGLNWYRANPLTIEATDDFMATLSPTIPVPVSVMWGLEDEYVLSANAEELEPYAPDLMVETVEGVGHWIEHQIPAEVARGVRELDARADLEQ